MLPDVKKSHGIKKNDMRNSPLLKCL